MQAPPLPDSLKASVESSQVEYVNLGKSGLRVSVPILGAMSIGDPEWAPWVAGEEESLPLLKAAYDRGLNTWDTANVYSNGASEIIIGKTIKKYQIPRHKLVILTKCHGAVGEVPQVRGFFFPKEIRASKDYVNQGGESTSASTVLATVLATEHNFNAGQHDRMLAEKPKLLKYLIGLSRAAIFNQVNASLARLDTDYIDLLQIHRFDANTPIEETMEALHDLVRSGKVRYIGASSMWATQFARMQFVAEQKGWTKFISMQNQYSLLYREEEREMNRFCNDTGVGLIPWAPLCRGHLARPLSALGSTTRSAPEKEKGLSDEDNKTIQRVQEIAEKKGWKMSHVAMAWINKRVSSPIIGFSTVERLDELIGIRGKTLTEDEEKYLEELYVPKANSGFS
ncbi:related to aryl-alcohol dehydrogenases [Rhynchosporium secalis]|uniref:Related to aryl-alcohol dehydrogenases n=1 Tax=Rhynchosporium secalis TaxID=38038 RepID=A0A1E1M1I3_RHYSE|nr:related to aryl-alcohol dehydrogenases [Rhynchosporium secalis]